MNEYHLIASNSHFAWRHDVNSDILKTHSTARVIVKLPDLQHEDQKLPPSWIVSSLEKATVADEGAVFLDHSLDIIDLLPGYEIQTNIDRSADGQYSLTMVISKDGEHLYTTRLNRDQLRQSRIIQMSELIQLSTGEIYPALATLSPSFDRKLKEIDPTTKVHQDFSIRSEVSEDIIAYSFSFEDKRYYAKQEFPLYPRTELPATFHASSLAGLAVLTLNSRGKHSWSTILRHVLQDMHRQSSIVSSSRTFRNKYALVLIVEELKLLLSRMSSLIDVSQLVEAVIDGEQGCHIRRFMAWIDDTLVLIKDLPDADRITLDDARRIVCSSCIAQISDILHDGVFYDAVDDIQAKVARFLCTTRELTEFIPDEQFNVINALNNRLKGILIRCPYSFMHDTPQYFGFTSGLISKLIHPMKVRLIRPVAICGKISIPLHTKHIAKVGGLTFEWRNNQLRVHNHDRSKAAVLDKISFDGHNSLLFVDPLDSPKVVLNSNFSNSKSSNQFNIEETDSELKITCRPIRENMGSFIVNSLTCPNRGENVWIMIPKIYERSGYSSMCVYKRLGDDGLHEVGTFEPKVFMSSLLTTCPTYETPKLLWKEEVQVKPVMLNNWFIWASFSKNYPNLAVLAFNQPENATNHILTSINPESYANTWVAVVVSPKGSSATVCIVFQHAQDKSAFTIELYKFDGKEFTRQTPRRVAIKSAAIYWTSYKHWLVCYTVDARSKSSVSERVTVRRYEVP